MDTVESADYEGVLQADILASEPNSFLHPIDLQSTSFRDQYTPLITTNLSSRCVKRDAVKVSSCLAVRNVSLEQRFTNFEKQLKAQKAPANISYGFMLLFNEKECQLFAQFGVPANNVLIGDLGEPCNGVYLHDYPDLVTPAPFLGQTRLKILACKILKGRTNYISLGSYRAMPTADCNSHKCPAPASRKLTRHEAFRYSQVFLFEQQGDGYSQVPANILPVAVFDLIFPHNSYDSFFSTFRIPSFKPMSFTVWNGTLKAGTTVLDSVRLSSTLPTLKPPFIESILEIKDFLKWSSCMTFAPLLELLTAPYLGELPLRTEVSLKEAKRCVSYFQLQSTHPNKHFNLFNESMRLRRVVGVAVFPTVGMIIMIPNSWFSSLLALPVAPFATLHCLYFTANEQCSLLSGMFDKFTAEDDAEFDRNPVLQEHIDGVSPRIQELVRRTADEIIKEQKEELKIITARAGAHPGDASALANQVVLIDSDDEDVTVLSSGNVAAVSSEAPATSSQLPPLMRDPRLGSTAGRNNTPFPVVVKTEPNSEQLPNSKQSDKVNSSSSKQVYRKHPTDPRTLPLPKLATSTTIKTESSELTGGTNVDTQQSSTSYGKERDRRCYSPSDAVSDTSRETSPSASASQSATISDSRTSETTTVSATKSKTTNNTQPTNSTNAPSSQRQPGLESVTGSSGYAQVYIASAKPNVDASPRTNVYAPHHFPAREYKEMGLRQSHADVQTGTSEQSVAVTEKKKSK